MAFHKCSVQLRVKFDLDLCETPPWTWSKVNTDNYTNYTVPLSQNSSPRLLKDDLDDFLDKRS